MPRTERRGRRAAGEVLFCGRRCGRVSFRVLFPWSLVRWFPFVKAAVMSTFFDNPCGPCNRFNSKQQMNKPENLVTTDEIKVYPKMLKASVEGPQEEIGPPIHIIFKEKHKHEGSNDVFEYTELRLGSGEYHRHFNSIDDIEFPQDGEQARSDGRSENLIVLDDSKSRAQESNFKHSAYRNPPNPIEPIKQDAEAAVPQDERSPIRQDNSRKEGKGLDAILREASLSCAGPVGPRDDNYLSVLFEDMMRVIHEPDGDFSPSEREEREGIVHHLEKLNNWISYIV